VLWKYVHDEIVRSPSGGSQVNSVWTKILENVHVLFFHRFTDDFTAFRPDAIKSVKKIFEKGDYAEIYGWLQFALRHQPPRDLRNRSKTGFGIAAPLTESLRATCFVRSGRTLRPLPWERPSDISGLPRWLVAASI
jgi:hypothetical protein